MVPNTGLVSEGWFYEDNQNTSRLGIRIDEHLHHEDSPFQKIDVYRSPFFGRFLTLDDLIMFTERDEFVYHEMLVHIPLCSIEDPRRVLIVGGGDCGCAREVLRHPSVEEIVQCDIDERVTRVCEEHFDWVAPVLADPRMHAVFADGVEYVKDHRDTFDLIIVDSTDPIGPAVGLFQASFFEAVARALRPGGVLANQCESPLWSVDLVARISAQLRRVFPLVHHYWGAIPTYPSGSWSWGYSSRDRRPDDHFDHGRAERIEAECRYWSSEIQRGSFALPRFLRQALDQ
jgi:spermidine synthase